MCGDSLLVGKGRGVGTRQMNLLEPDSHYPIDLRKLPQTWAVAYLGDIIRDIRSGFSSGEHNSQGIGTPHLRPMNIDRQGRIVLDDVRYISPNNDLRLAPGDVLFNNTNSQELVGKTAPIVEQADWAFSNHMTRLRPPSGISHRFVAYQLHFLWLAGYFRYRSTQHVNQASISTQTLARTVPLIVPPSAEQLRIVAEIEKQFSRLDETEGALTQAISQLQTYNRTVLRRAVEGSLIPNEGDLAIQENRPFETADQLLDRILPKVVPADKPEQLTLLDESTMSAGETKQSVKRLDIDLPDPTKFPKLPTGWMWVRVKHVGKVTLGRQRAPQHQNGPYMRPYLRVANVFENRIDTTDVLQMNFTPEEYEIYRLQTGDILLNEGQSLDLVGRAAMYHDEVPGACFQNTLIRFRAYEGLNATFALIVFRHYFFTKRYQKLATWSTNIAHLGAGRFANVEFPLPPLAEQDRIVAEVERCLSITEKLSTTIAAAIKRISQIRFTILKRAFTGILVTQDPNDLPVDKLLAAINSMEAPTKKRIRRNKSSSEAQDQRNETMRARRKLYDVLRAFSKELRPEELLRESSIGEDLIEEFFLELKHEVEKGNIIERRDSNGMDVFLYAAGGKDEN